MAEGPVPERREVSGARLPMAEGEPASPRGARLWSAAHPLWGRGFRPFFLGTSIYAAVVVIAWVAMWRGVLPAPAPAWLPLMWWHGHEMVFGVVGGAIGGFLLTASAHWSGRPAIAGRLLAALFGLWVAGRLAMLGAGVLPAGLVAAVDLSFLVALVLAVGRLLAGTGQRRNYVILGLVGALAVANAAVHAQALGLTVASAPTALRAAVYGVVALIVMLGGRLTPSFTARELTRRGDPAVVRTSLWVDGPAVGAVVALVLVDLLAGRGVVTGALACAGAVAGAVRLAGWQGHRVWRDPLLLSLHAGMAWVVVGLFLVGLSDLGLGVPLTAGLHALAAGAMGGMILAVMTRASLGHTGRPLVLPRGGALIYALVHAGALARVVSVFDVGALAGPLLVVSGVLWAGAFALYAALFAPILLGPRADGKPP